MRKGNERKHRMQQERNGRWSNILSQITMKLINYQNQGEEMKKYKLYAITLAGTILLNGCATNAPLSVRNKQTIHTVMIDQNVKNKPAFYYRGPSVGGSILGAVVGGAIGGAVGGTIGAVKDANETNKLQKLISVNKINVDKIARDQFVQEVTKRTNLKFIKQEPADAKFVVKVNTYGLSTPSAYSSQLSPVMIEYVYLIKDNRTIARGGCYIGPPVTETPKYSTKILKDPAMLTQAWTIAANKAAKCAIKRMRLSD